MKPDRAGLPAAACNAMQCNVQLLFAEDQRVPLMRRVHVWSAVVCRRRVDGCIDRWICIERGADAMPDIARRRRTLSYPCRALPFTIDGAAIKEG
jgi:hypothetical protein